MGSEEAMGAIEQRGHGPAARLEQDEQLDRAGAMEGLLKHPYMTNTGSVCHHSSCAHQ